MATKSGITLTEIDPAGLDTPSAGKDTIFMDATASPPAPAYMDSSRVVTSLIGPAGPAGPAGPTGSITVAALGALNGDGSGGNPLAVSVDGVTIDINASNELEVLGGVTSSRQLWQYKAKTSATSGYPGNGYMLWDNATQTSATNLLFSHLSADGFDIDIFLGLLVSGDTIYLQDEGDSGNLQQWTISGSPTNTNPGTPTSYWTVPVTLVTSAGTGTTGFSNNHQLIAVIYTASGGGTGTVTHTGALTSGKTIVGNGGVDVTVSSLTGALVSSSAGTLGAVAVGTGVQISGATLSAKTDNETIGVDSNGKLEVIANYLLKALVRQGLIFNSGWLDVNVDNETIGIDSHNKLQVIAPLPQPAEVVISTQSPSGTGVVTFSNISQAYQDLRIVVRGAGDTSATNVAVNLTLNNDGGSNYDWGFVGIQTATTANASCGSGDTKIAIGVLAAATAPSGTPGYAEFVIYNYSGTAFHKAVNCESAVKTANSTNGIFRRAGSGWWRSVSAVTRVDLTLGAGSYVSGTRVTLLGRLG